MDEIRLAVERALSKLVNRFGLESEVIAELEDAVDRIKRLQAAEEPPEPEPESPAPAEAPPVQKAGAPGSKPRKAGVKRGK